MFDSTRNLITGIFNSPNMPSRRPVLDDHFESNVRGLYCVGELAGAPVVKLAMEQGYQVARDIAAKPDARGNDDAIYDLLVVGSGAAGLTAALEAQHRGLRVLVLEKAKIANTIEDLPEGKWIYTEPNDRPAVGRLWLDECTKEELARRWNADVMREQLNVRPDEAVTGVRRSGSAFTVETSRGRYQARRVVVAIGKSGTPRKLGVPGEDLAAVHHKLYSPKPYTGKRVLVVGGGNSAIEAALALSAKAESVTVSYRGSEFYRVSKENARQFSDAVGAGRIEVVQNSKVTAFEPGHYTLEAGGRQERRTYDHAFVLVGSEPPTAFLRSIGLRLENDWTAGRIAALLFCFALCYSVYGIKQGPGHEFWPYRGWGANLLTFAGRGPGFWYTVLYTALMTVFGYQAMKRWGLDRKDKFQIWRYVSLIGFQWLFFFLIPEFLFRWAVQYQWVGERLASDPSFANNAWRSYGIVYAWPLFFYTFFSNPHQVWIVWGALLTFVLIPIFVLFHGKRYCSWICGCGGLAETFGDRWRHLAPKGETSIRWERMNSYVLVFAVVVTVLVLGKDAVTLFRKPSDFGLELYHFTVDTWLVSIIPVALYPFMGGKVWCRYWCPLAKLMEIFSRVFTRLNVSRFAIQANDKCIACEDCTRNCQVGIDVMRYALKQEEITNMNSSCIGCGICVTVCPMNVLSFAKPGQKPDLVQISKAA